MFKPHLYNKYVKRITRLYNIAFYAVYVSHSCTREDTDTHPHDDLLLSPNSQASLASQRARRPPSPEVNRRGVQEDR